jgi:hypothetical protein
VLFALGGVATALSLFGMWHHVTIGPLYGPGLELGVGALAVSAVCFFGSYWYAG